ncbi:hypothetical protein [Endozoicomonas sp. ALD040]|uniref:hypothetical protein n=1 Tax=Endozoicomonas sp. ALD040 TaxID=3403079 RepID=UPI003BB1747B
MTDDEYEEVMAELRDKAPSESLIRRLEAERSEVLAELKVKAPSQIEVNLWIDMVEHHRAMAFQYAEKVNQWWERKDACGVMQVHR